MFFGGTLIVGVGDGSNHRLAIAILACLGLGAGVGFANGVLVGVFRLNPLIVTLAVGQIVLAWGVKYSRGVVEGGNVPEALSSRASASASTRRSVPSTCWRRSPQSSSQGRRSPAGSRARRRPGSPRSR